MPGAGKSIVQFLGWAINILVSHGGEGNLLHELQIFRAEARQAQNDGFAFFLLFWILISIAFIWLVRYMLGHTLANILTLQSIYSQNHGRKHEDEGAKHSTLDAPLSRHLVNSLRVLYAHLGLSILVKGLYIAAIYRLLKIAVKSILKATIFRPVKIHPIADIVATILLAETHMYWTHATISLRKSSWRIRWWSHDCERWKKLVLPSAAQSTAVILLDWFSTSLPNMSDASNSDGSRTLSAIAVLRVFIALIVRSFVLTPMTAWLTLVEASCLDSEQETLVYEQKKEKFVNVGAVFAGYEQKGSGELWKGVSLHLCLKQLELHVKKCAVHMVLHGLIFRFLRNFEMT